MAVLSNSLKLVLFLLVMLTAPKLWAQGPPYQTDDPTPVDFKHYEAYILGRISPVNEGFPTIYTITMGVHAQLIVLLGPYISYSWYGAIVPAEAANIAAFRQLIPS